MRIQVYGTNTWKCREELKNFGLKWNDTTSKWSDDVSEETCRKIIEFAKSKNMSYESPLGSMRTAVRIHADLRGIPMWEGREKGKFRREHVYIEERR